LTETSSRWTDSTLRAPSRDWRHSETLAKRWIEDHGFDVHDANLVLRANCPNIDLIVYGRTGAIYVQTKSSEYPAGNDCVVVDGSPWTEPQLYKDAPIFNRHNHYLAAFVIVVDKQKNGEVHFYVAPPSKLEQLVRARGIEHAERPKRDGRRRSVSFRKELPRATLLEWRDAWDHLGIPVREPSGLPSLL
jgi:hypothetical protein